MRHFKFKIHPLFWIFGVILVLIGDGYLFLVYIFTAVIHEFAHTITASFYNCRSNEIVLYPYGAVLYGEFSTLKPSEEAVVALSGPLFNLFVAVLFTALWWVMPEIYAFTDVIVIVNISIGVFNLIPVYPLDGGRILLAVLKIKKGYTRAYKLVKIMGIFCCLGFAALYFYTFFTQINYTFAVISVFLLSAILEKNSESGVDTVLYPPNQRFLQRGVEKKFIQVSYELSLFKLLKMLNTEHYFVIEIKDINGKTTDIIEHKDLESIVIKNNLQTLLKDIVV